MLNCKQATELMSQERDRPLGFAERMGLRMHVAMCAGCRNFRKQMDFLHQAGARYQDAATKQDDDAEPM